MRVHAIIIEELSIKHNALYPNNMLFSKPFINTGSLKTHKSRYVDRDFQKKYIGLFVGSCLFALIVTVLPLYYYWRQNNNIFVNLAYEVSPTLVEHLEREYIWLHIFLVASIAGSFLFFLVMSLKISEKVIAPIKLMRNHIAKLTHGEWHIRPLKIRNDDEFQDLVNSYNYFFHCFKQNAQLDLERLKKMNISPENYSSFLIWKQMIEEKEEQLNLKPAENNFSVISSNVLESHDQHHAS